MSLMALLSLALLSLFTLTSPYSLTSYVPVPGPTVPIHPN